MQKDASTPEAPKPACKHTRTQVIAKDDNAEYVECLDCGEILEVDELKEKDPGFGESISDA
jgi:Zn ribbon nucleic-acid-binding protein